VYTLERREDFSWPLRVYLSVVEVLHPQLPRGTLLDVKSALLPAVGGSFLVCWPQNPLGFGISTPNSFGVYIFLSKIIADPSTKPADGFGRLTPNLREKRGFF
jgi:hypothetical protein